MSWAKETNKNYRGAQWEVVRAHLEGRVLDDLPSYLIRKRQGEADEAYETRKDIASYVPHYTRAVISLAGMIMQNEKEAVRSWWDEGTELEGPEGEGVMRRLWRNADGEGTDWPVLLVQALVQMIGYQRIWGIVDGIDREAEGEVPTLADARSDGRVRVIAPLAVMDWVRDESGRLTSVKVETKTDVRSSVKEEREEVKRWHVYTLEGVEVYEEDEDAEDGTRLVDSRPYGLNGFQYQGQDGRPILPIWTTKVPLSAPVGYMMARYATWLFNFRNVRNFHLWASAIARSWVNAVDDSGRFDDQLWEKINELAQDGATMFPKEIGYSSPSMEGAETRNSTLETERDDFYTVFFQSYGDAAREATATEIRQDIAEGVAAYLALQVRALDEWENDALWRLGQVHMPNASPEVWGQARVMRSEKFEVKDINKTIEQLRSTYLQVGQDLPSETRLDILTQLLDHLAVEYDREEMRQQQEVQRLEREQALQGVLQDLDTLNADAA